MIISILPACVMPAGGRDTCASTLHTATAVPGRSPVSFAACSVISPALSPMGRMSLLIFLSITRRSRSSREAKKSSDG